MKISLLHLSDIHIHGDNDEILKESTNIASTCFADAHTSDAFFIIITGDVSYSGSVEEYKAITPFLNNIKNLIRAEGCPIVEILTVPGNHDCILKPTSTVRELLIQNVISNPEISEDDSVTTECSKVQDNYFEFRDQITQTASKFDHKLLTEYEFLICNKIVRFTAINASWMSRIPEVPGQLVFPANKFSDVISQPAEFRFVLIHHPLNWYYPSSSSELRRLINTHATAILSGHEHAEHNGITQDFDLGKNLYFEARALQPHEGNLKAGYSILTFNYGDQEVGRTATQKSFELDQNEINIMSVTDIPLEGVNSSLKECLALKDDFLKKICDPGGGYIHPDKEHLDIDDLFIYPEFKRKKFKEDKDDIEPIHYSIPSEEIMNAEMEQSKLLILGDEKAGKSTLLFKAYRELHNKGLMPLYIKANEINSYNESDFTKLIDK
jgi:hypothetical protein